jgi:hypothetical protein
LIHVVAHGVKAPATVAFMWWCCCGGVPLPVLSSWQTIPPRVAIMAFSAVFEGAISPPCPAIKQVTCWWYPLARGTAPLLTLIWATMFLKEQTQWGGIFGIALIALGLYVINLLNRAWLEPLRNSIGPPTPAHYRPCI